MRFNVVFMVLDTLREDYASGLGKLEGMGFVKYENAIAPSNWTIPSHVSMFTGRLPSSHGMHEDRDTHASNFGKLSAANLAVERKGVLGELRDRGYAVQAFTANPLVSPVFGFPFPECDVFDEAGEVTEVRRYVRKAGGNWPRGAMKMVRDGKTGALVRRTYKAVKRRAPRLLDRSPLEKGSRYIIDSLESWKVREPFMLFINVMEAHQPYSWNDGKPGAEATYCYLTGKPYRLKLDWGSKYRKHAELATSRAVDIAESAARLPKNTLFVVTSDHGQLLGDQGKYDHGYFLDDALLRVPLYVKYPEGVKPFSQREGHVSTSEIPFLIESVLYGARAELGSACVAAESFGPQWPVMDFAKDDGERRALAPAYRHKVKIYTHGGDFTLDASTGAIEDRKDGVTDKDVAACLKSLPLGGARPA